MKQFGAKLKNKYTEPQTEVINIKTAVSILAGSPPLVPIDPAEEVTEQW